MKNIPRQKQFYALRAHHGWLEGALWILALLVMFVWSAWPALKAVTATFSIKPVSKQVVVEGVESARLEIQRNVQKQFLDYGVYIPLEDIMFTGHFVQTNADFEPVVKRICGEAPLVVWVPLQFRLPLVGERSVEWCWKPSLKN